MLRYLTHPEVEVDKAVPVEQWGLSALGRARAERMLERPWVDSVRRIVTSPEAKAVETAQLLAARVGIAVESRPETGELDRSAAGFLPPAEYELVTDACFAEPTVSVRGWERAIDAQARIVSALADLLDDNRRGDVLIVGHGGVGTLWYCHLAGVTIARRWDQPGQGHHFTVDSATRHPLHHWRRIDD